MGTEATRTEASSSATVPAVSVFLANPLPESPAAVQKAPFVAPISHFPTQTVPAFPVNQRNEANMKATLENVMPSNNNDSAASQLPFPGQGVSSCYIFKSRLQEYAQKKSLPTPVYETIKEGPSHQPYFRSTVIVKDVRYDSLPGFFNRKAAEQSAAEVALTELAKSDEVECISLPVHETGLCKNLLQEYAQKMNYAIPLYECQKVATPTGRSRSGAFQCTVEVGGMRYIGGAAKTKREAEIKAARTALLALQSGTPNSGNSQLTVIPFRKGPETAAPSNVPKAKKPRFKKKTSKNKFSKYKAKNNTVIQATGDGLLPLHVNQNAADYSENGSATVDQNAANNSENRSITTEKNGANDSENGSMDVDCNRSIDGMSGQVLPESNEVRASTEITGVKLLGEM